MQRTTARPTLQDVAAGSFGSMLVHDWLAADRDPLNADLFFAQALPSINKPLNMPWSMRRKLLLAWLEKLAPTEQMIQQMDLADAQAATRDLAMIASSLRRIDVDTCTVPVLEQALIRLARVTGEVPADTCYSYGSRNPDGPRVRRFTNNPQELNFIHCIRSGMEQLPLAIERLWAARNLSISNPEYARLLREANGYLRPMVDAIHSSMSGVSPEFFTGVLRGFFESKTVGGNTYKAAGAAQMPIIWVDLLLWAIEEVDQGYLDYFEENLQYQPPEIRELASSIRMSPSLLALARKEAEDEAEGFDLTPAVRESLQALADLLKTMLDFRGPHIRVARANFKIRPTGSKGSGGYNAEFLILLIEKTRDARSEVLRLIAGLK
jgi:hypothetical protein